MPEPNSEELVPELSEQQKYVNEKVAALLDQIGDEYGESLTQQLVQRLDTTVADFHEEVTNLLSELKEKSVSRQEQLRDAWQHRFDTPPQAEVPAATPEAGPAKEQGDDSSDWEKRLETKESREAGEAPAKEAADDDGKKKKKKGFFGRKKK